LVAFAENNKRIAKNTMFTQTVRCWRNLELAIVRITKLPRKDILALR
jgi:hypothetical protein